MDHYTEGKITAHATLTMVHHHLIPRYLTYPADTAAEEGDQQEEAQRMLLHMMASSAAGLHTACDTAEDGALGGKKKKKKELEEEGEGSLALASQLAKSLPQLLDKYGVQPEQLQAVLKLLKELRLDSAQAPHPVP